MRLILHAGTHKTGTSTLQRVLDGARQQLRGHGLLYPDTREHFGGDHPAHHPFAHRIAEHGAEDEKVRGFVAHLLRMAQHHDVVLLSAEPVYRHVLRHDSGPWWDRHARYLEAMAVALAPFDVEPLLVFRRRDTFLESIYHERVAHGFGASFEHLVSRSDRLVDYTRQLQLFRHAFAPARTASYEELSARGLIDGFFDLIGVPAPPTAEPSWERRSPDARITLWMAQGNREDDRPELVTQRRRFSKHPRTRELFDDFGQVTLWDDAHQRQELLRRYGDTAPIRDPRPPARLDADTTGTLDEAFAAYLANKGLDAFGTPVRQS